MPANAPKKIPKYGFPNIKTDPNAATAPVSIIPSTPKFKHRFFLLLILQCLPTELELKLIKSLLIVAPSLNALKFNFIIL